MEIKHYVEMKCIRCKKRKPLKDFWFDYNVRRPICLACWWNNKEFLKKWIYIALNWKLRITFEKNYHFVFEKKKKKRKYKYNAEFRRKSKAMLQYARQNNWCTDCWSKDILQVHHIDKNTFNNSDENLVVLCYYCHAKHHKHMQHKPPSLWIKNDFE